MPRASVGIPSCCSYLGAMSEHPNAGLVLEQGGETRFAVVEGWTPVRVSLS